ncbi:hypothetical protein K431DRAFT_337775 [Polychaeton citri CBS 116435]|uniref:DUF1772-domain-containing protein n=1 Tax=Polychaeton citri CBS 116435 TaxID=1314669 RepID=A0A9P4QDP3_9PEZI|nr:hypothetical protein K431DRAFT_337775 [Polychaeton citri CBS 116435]
MASTGKLWWITPLQCFAVLGAATNLGGSALQSPLIMPMLQIPNVAAQPASAMTDYLLHNSEFFFPPLNASCTLANIVMTVTAYLNRNTDNTAAAKLPYLAAATIGSISTTAWSLLIQVPINKKIGVLAKKLEKDPQDAAAEKEFRELQEKWRKRNYGRAVTMISTAIVGITGLVTDGSVLRL